MSHPNENSNADRHLVEKILGGDKYAFGILIKNTEGLVSQMVFKMINSPTDRKDIAQDVYLKAFKYLSGFRFQSKLSSLGAHAQGQFNPLADKEITQEIMRSIVLLLGLTLFQHLY
jgi:hypothetical protein